MIKIKIEMFESYVHILTEEKDFIKFLKKQKGKIKAETVKDFDGFHGICYNFGGNQYIILKKKTIDVLVHELLHAVKGICDHRGVDDEETECYMLDYLTASALNKLKITQVK